MGNNNQTLVERARAGDRSALEQLLVIHSGELRDHVARRLPTSLQSKLAVEDVMQEALTQAYLKIDGLRGGTPRAVATWLKAIGEMSLVDFIRAEGAQKRGGEHRQERNATDSISGSLVDLLEHLPDDAATASQAVARQDALNALQVAVAALPGQQRQAIQLNVLQGNTVEQTAEAMGCTPGAIRGLVHRAKQNLAAAMGRASLWLSQR